MDNNRITQERKAALIAINDEGNRWKHDELLARNVNRATIPSGIWFGQINIMVEEPPVKPLIGPPPPPYQQRQLERADMLERVE